MLLATLDFAWIASALVVVVGVTSHLGSGAARSPRRCRIASVGAHNRKESSPSLTDREDQNGTARNTDVANHTNMRPLLCVVAALAVGAAADDYASLESTPFAGIAPFAEVAHRPLARQLTRHRTVPSQLDNHSPSM